MSQIYVPLKLTPEEVRLLDALIPVTLAENRAAVLREALYWLADVNFPVKALIPAARASRANHPPRRRQRQSQRSAS